MNQKLLQFEVEKNTRVSGYHLKVKFDSQTRSVVLARLTVAKGAGVWGAQNHKSTLYKMSASRVIQNNTSHTNTLHLKVKTK